MTTDEGSSAEAFVDGRRRDLTEGRGRRLKNTVLGRRPQADRLREGILALAAEHWVRGVSVASPEAGRNHANGREAASLIRQHLLGAVQMYEKGRYDVGWGLLHRAQETEIRLLSRAELHGVAVALVAEADGDKLKGWRLKAIRSLLGQMHQAPPGVAVVPPFESATPSREEELDPVRRGGRGRATPQGSATGLPVPSTTSAPARRGRGLRRRRLSAVVPQRDCDEDSLAHDAALVQQALAIRNGHFANQYTTLDITAHRRLWLLLMGLVLLGAFVAIVLTNGVQLDPPVRRGDPAAAVLQQPWVIGSMLLLGALGSVVSAIQRLVSQPLMKRIPDQLGSFTATVTRPLIGTVAALTVLLAALGGLAVPEERPVPLMLLAAFTAGLSERLVVHREKSDSSPPAA